MKKIGGILFLFLSSPLFSQGLVELFYMLPDEFASGIVLNDRKALIKDSSVVVLHTYSNGEVDEEYFTLRSQDKTNGYLAFTRDGHQCSDWEMCFWNMKNGSKLVAVNGPSDCLSGLHFFEVKDGKMSYAFDENRLIQSLSPFHFFKSNTNYSLLKEYMECPLDFALPQKGVNIICSLYWTCSDDNDAIRRGTRFDLIWKDDHFEIGEPYF